MTKAEERFVEAKRRLLAAVIELEEAEKLVEIRKL